MASVKSVLAPAAKEDFASIVGARYVTDDDAVLSGYSWTNGISKVPPAGQVFASFWPVAVVMPSTTEEVAAVVKCCKRHGLTFKAHSTGYGAVMNVNAENCISIDLRRMNQMKLVPEDRMVILEPYVTAGQLQAEAMEHGLTCHIVGAGPVHSPLASATSLFGVGVTGQATSMNARNLLSWEWVSPEGEIIRGGSAGSDNGWFTGDGPGPGTRGMLRGLFGYLGAMGVFTKIGYKLYPVPYKGQFGGVGRLPQIGSVIPENVGLFHAVWPDWESQAQASFELVQDDLTFAMLRTPPNAIGWTVTSSNAEYIRKLDTGTLPPVASFDNDKHWSILTMSKTAAEHKWRSEAVKDIVERTGGRFVELSVEDAQVIYRGFVTAQYVARVLRPAAGGILTSFGILDSFHFLPRAMEAGEKALLGENKPGGKLTEGYKEEQWAWSNERRYLWSENILQFDPRDEESSYHAARGFLEYFRLTWKEGIIGSQPFLLGPIADLTGPERVGHAPRYCRKVKQHFDPDNVSFSADTVDPNVPPAAEKILPYFRPLVGTNFTLNLMAKMLVKKGM